MFGFLEFRIPYFANRDTDPYSNSATRLYFVPLGCVSQSGSVGNRRTDWLTRMMWS